MEAIRFDTGFSTEKPFLACHFSGGTTEILLVEPRIRSVVHNTGIFYKVAIIGGTKDIAYGQVLDRAGVALGMQFPAGEEMDRAALDAADMTEYLTPVKAINASVNLSGIDSQIRRTLEAGLAPGEQGALIREIFTRLSDSILQALEQAASLTGIRDVLMAGGVSSSSFIRQYIQDSDRLDGCNVLFGRPELSQDNAVGTAILGGRYLWD